MAQQVIAKLIYKNGYKFEITDVAYFNRWLKYTTHKWLCENPFSNDTKIFNEI